MKDWTSLQLLYLESDNKTTSFMKAQSPTVVVITWNFFVQDWYRLHPFYYCIHWVIQDTDCMCLAIIPYPAMLCNLSVFTLNKTIVSFSDPRVRY